MTGKTAAGRFTGHTAWVSSVAFSPDGQYIVAGSDDGPIRVWNVMTGETAAGPFSGHTGWVSSVAFSPDSQYIVSSSHDGTIRLWNAVTGGTAAGLFIERIDSVISMAFSPAGQQIVSGSVDRTIRASNDTIGKTGTKNDVDLTDHFMMNDEGWICGGNGGLLMWIPSVHREYFCRTIWISGKRRTILNLSDFVHGRSWATCINTGH
jgi:WD40 repeat protein